MGFFDKRPQQSLDDPDFGRITEGKAGSWEGDAFQLWGRVSIQVMIDAGADGPSEEQRSFVRLLRSDHEGIRARIEEAVGAHTKETASQTGILVISSIYLRKSPLQQLWKVWFDMEGEEHYWYGAEIQGWDRIVPFTED
jgi:hypothetical protein